MNSRFRGFQNAGKLHKLSIKLLSSHFPGLPVLAFGTPSSPLLLKSWWQGCGLPVEISVFKKYKDLDTNPQPSTTIAHGHLAPADLNKKSIFSPGSNITHPTPLRSLIFKPPLPHSLLWERTCACAFRQPEPFLRVEVYTYFRSAALAPRLMKPPGMTWSS